MGKLQPDSVQPPSLFLSMVTWTRRSSGRCLGDMAIEAVLQHIADGSQDPPAGYSVDHNSSLITHNEAEVYESEVAGHAQAAEALNMAISCLFLLRDPKFSVTVTSYSFDSLEGGTRDEVMVVTLQYHLPDLHLGLPLGWLVNLGPTSSAASLLTLLSANAVESEIPWWLSVRGIYKMGDNNQDDGAVDPWLYVGMRFEADRSSAFAGTTVSSPGYFMHDTLELAPTPVILGFGSLVSVDSGKLEAYLGSISYGLSAHDAICLRKEV
ncbi:hypothetical protein DFH29DRAFT_875062 [Suillus ampliporus]|nr:hypothetical protein DFH29DRAFT_875062 [Suillus ampliporus]